MTGEFVPLGYVAIGDSEQGGPALRQQLAAGTLTAAVWNPRSGELVQVSKETWLADWSQHLIDTGIFEEKYQDYFGMPRTDRCPVLLKVGDPPAVNAGQKPIGRRKRTGKERTDEPLVKRMRELIDSGKANSATDAAKIVLDRKGTESDVRRLQRRYDSTYGE